MRSDYYILQDGTLKRDENTIYFVNEFERRAIPVEKIYSIYAYGSLTFTSGAALYLAKEGIPVHFFNYYGYYSSTLYPRESLVSGDMVVKQAAHYLDQTKRLFIAKRFVEGASKNILRNLKYYSKENPQLEKSVSGIEGELSKLDGTGTVPEIMNVEGRIREMYYTALDEIFPEGYKIVKRTRMPPENRMNTLISFGNSLMYSTVLSEIYNTQLNPTISFLHEPFERRFSLALDVSEIFKPIIVDRVIFKLVNKNMLGDEHFRGEIGDMMLSEKGKKLFLQEYNDKMKVTIEHRGLDRQVSFKRLIRLELYKLAKHMLGESEYKPLVMWW